MEILPSQDQMCAWFLPILKSQGRVFRKFRKIWAKPAVGGERVETRTSDGLETINTASPGDFIVRNQTLAAEMYVMSAKNLQDRYLATGESNEEGYFEYAPTGKILAIELTEEILNGLELPDSFHFTASWGAAMVAKAGDFLVCPPTLDSVYRIARAAFFETYLPFNPTS